VLPRIIKRLKESFRLWKDEPKWLWFCRLVFLLSAFSFLVSFFGPGILSGDLIAFWLYSNWSLTSVGSPFIVVIVVTFLLVVISGIPTFLYERKRIKELRRKG